MSRRPEEGSLTLLGPEKSKPTAPETCRSSASFDAMRSDLRGQFDVAPAGFAEITRVAVKLAEELCQGHIVSVLEGSYRLDGLAESVVAHVKGLEGE